MAPLPKKNEEEILLDMPAKVVNGRVFVPLRFVGEQLGLNVVWDKETKTVALTEKQKYQKHQNIQVKIKAIV